MAASGPASVAEWKRSVRHRARHGGIGRGVWIAYSATGGGHLFSIARLAEDWDAQVFEGGAHDVRLVVSREAAPAPKSVEETFRELADLWKRDTRFQSSPQRVIMHPAYQRIIGLGRPAIPLILEELEEAPRLWYWALSAITGEDPAEGEESIAGAAEAWLTWGRAQGHIA